MMKSRIICILLLLVGVSGIYAQSLTVTGKVVDNCLLYTSDAADE